MLLSPRLASEKTESSSNVPLLPFMYIFPGLFLTFFKIRLSLLFRYTLFWLPFVNNHFYLSFKENDSISIFRYHLCVQYPFTFCLQFLFFFGTLESQLQFPCLHQNLEYLQDLKLNVSQIRLHFPLWESFLCHGFPSQQTVYS